jgi:serine/threonine-protein kinase
MSLRRALNLALQVCRGLAVAHAHGVVHRDLKPSNLAITSELGGHEHCTILDFGVAKWLESSSPETESTKTGALVGTLAYMPPEQIRGVKDLDARADVYALGAIMYECLCGERPFEADSPHALMYRILHGRPRSIASLRTDLPAEVATLLSRALASDRTQRFANVGEFASALDALVPGSSARPTSLDPTLPSGPGVGSASEIPGRPRAGRHARWLLPAVAAALVGGFTLSRTDEAPESASQPAVSAWSPAASALPALTAERPVVSEPSAAALAAATAVPSAVEERIAAAPVQTARARAVKPDAPPAPPATSEAAPHVEALRAADPLAKRGYVTVSPYGLRPSTASFSEALGE